MNLEQIVLRLNRALAHKYSLLILGGLFYLSWLYMAVFLPEDVRIIHSTFLYNPLHGTAVFLGLAVAIGLFVRILAARLRFADRALKTLAIAVISVASVANIYIFNRLEHEIPLSSKQPNNLQGLAANHSNALISGLYAPLFELRSYVRGHEFIVPTDETLPSWFADWTLARVTLADRATAIEIEKMVVLESSTILRLKLPELLTKRDFEGGKFLEYIIIKGEAHRRSQAVRRGERVYLLIGGDAD